MSNLIVVGISDLNVARPPDLLVTYALGSCVGICLYDNISKTAGLAHIMLPSSESTSPASAAQPYRFADTGIAALVRKMELLGVPRTRLRAKIAGGAQMFAAINNSSISNIGQRNVDAVRATLMSLRIPIIADDTGADYGRTVFFNPENGGVRVKSATKGEWML